MDFLRKYDRFHYLRKIQENFGSGNFGHDRKKNYRIGGVRQFAKVYPVMSSNVGTRAHYWLVSNSISLLHPARCSQTPSTADHDLEPKGLQQRSLSKRNVIETSGWQLGWKQRYFR